MRNAPFEARSALRVSHCLWARLIHSWVGIRNDSCRPCSHDHGQRRCQAFEQLFRAAQTAVHPAERCWRTPTGRRGVPAAFFGAWLLSQLGNTPADQAHLKTLLGWALVVACASLLTRTALSARLHRRGGHAENPAPWRLKVWPTILVGLVGGFMVGMTSVGSGSLIIVLLMLLYPRLSSNVQVGTNLVQAVPLVAVAALGQALFGHVELNIAGALIVGSVPGTFVGARVSSRAPDAIVRTIVVALLASSGLALLVTSNAGLAWALGIVAVVGLALWGAVDGALHLSEDWQSAGHDRTTWVALMGVGAPVGVGLVASAVYAFRIRPSVIAEATANGPDDP